MSKALVSLSLLLALLPQNPCAAMPVASGLRDYIPGPRIVSPRSDEVEVPGDGALQLKWSPHESVDSGGAYYDLRIYKGYEPVHSARIYKAKLPKTERSAWVEAEIFEDGLVYTWALRKVYDRIGNSRWSFQSFRVIKTEK